MNKELVAQSEVVDEDEVLVPEENAEDESEVIGGYELSIELSVLDHLGINLYSNVPAVLTELVANAWDADAKKVSIEIDVPGDCIVIADNGVGMTHNDVNEKFLTVGYRRRAKGDDRTPGGRPVMGRKGVGKLAPFSIAKEVSVFSTKDGECCGLKMKLADIEAVAGSARKHEQGRYRPEVLDSLKEEMPKVGTRIVLRDLKKHRVRAKNLRERLARRFSVIGTDDFTVAINDEDVTSKDRGDLSACQYLWKIGDWKKPQWLESVKRESTLDSRLDGWESSRRVRGWLGTAYKPKDLTGAAGNLNGVVVIARGRLFQENILSAVADSRHYMEYLTGQIEVDFLDESGDQDIATSDRQRVIEDDQRYEDLLVYLKKVLGQLERQWTEWRRMDDPTVVEDEFPAIRNWIASLDSEGLKRNARRVIGVVERLRVDDEAERRQLLKHAIYGFERMKLKGMSDALASAIESGSVELIRLFADHDAVEGAAYRDIVSGRLEAIRALEKAVDLNVKEKVLQQHIFKRLWLLDPSWERATGSEYMETRVAKMFAETHADRDVETSNGRVDIAYKTVAGKHVIVELKRAGRVVTLQELMTQGKGYVNDLKKMLVSTGEAKAESMPSIEVVFVVGQPVPEQQHNHADYENAMRFVSPGSRILQYDELIHRAQQAYGEYMEATAELNSLNELMTSLDG